MLESQSLENPLPAQLQANPISNNLGRISKPQTHAERPVSPAPHHAQLNLTISSLAPQTNTAAEYTSPTVAFPDGLYLADSAVIRHEIEKRHPNPSVHLDAPVLARLEAVMAKLSPTLSTVYIPLIPKRILNEASHEHWYRTREARFGMSLDRVAKEKGGQIAWDAAQPLIEQVTEMLKETDGPFFMGETVSYADFVWGGLLIFLQRVGMDVWQDFQKTAGEGSALNSKLLLALGPWSLRDDR